MTNTKLLIGSLSNDLYRVASLAQRGSTQAAGRFLIESQKWVADLSDKKTKKYIKKIIDDLKKEPSQPITPEKAEKYLMYSILLQNYALHID